MATAAALARPLSYAVGAAASGVGSTALSEAVIGAVAGGGALGGMAVAHWLVLRGRVSWAGRWPGSLAAAGGTAAAVGFATSELFVPGTPPPVPLAFGIAAFVLVHWLFLRRRLPRAAWLAAATAGGFLLAAALTAAAAAAIALEGESPLFGFLFGTLFGIVTAFALGRLSPRTNA